MTKLISIKCQTGQRTSVVGVDCYKFYCIGRVFAVAEERSVNLFFANIYNLLNLFPPISNGSGYNARVQGDVTHKASSAALNKLVNSTNRLDGHFAPLVHALVPAESESFDFYAAIWQDFDVSAGIVCLLKACGNLDCKAQILDMPYNA